MASGVDSPISSVMALMRDLSMPPLAHMVVVARAAPAARSSRRVMELIVLLRAGGSGAPMQSSMQDLGVAVEGAGVAAVEQQEARDRVARRGDQDALAHVL